MSTRTGTGTRAAAVAVAVAALLGGCTDGTAASAPGTTTPPAEAASPSAGAPAAEPPPPERLSGVVSSDDVETPDDPLEVWAEESRAEPVEVTSTADGEVQDVLWAPPPEPVAGAGSPPVVHVHSWSSGYDQEVGLPVAAWADSLGWGFLQPDFRGANDSPDATGSPLTTQDVVDAVDFAVAQGGVDPERVYVTGYSGGGMMSLLLAGRHPDRFAGVAAHVPVYDLGSWYEYNADEQPQRDYADQIAASCGGDPTEDGAAREECAARSPSAVVGAARTAGVPVYLAHGVDDDVVPVVDVLRAFNALAEAGDRIPDDVLGEVEVGALPEALGAGPGADTRFTDEDPEVLFSAASAAATVVVFDGGHEFVYYPGLDWLARLDASTRD